jgi:hypothetical protein
MYISIYLMLDFEPVKSGKLFHGVEKKKYAHMYVEAILRTSPRPKKRISSMGNCCGSALAEE